MNIKNVMMMAAMMPAFALAETNSNSAPASVEANDTTIRVNDQNIVIKQDGEQTSVKIYKMNGNEMTKISETQFVDGQEVEKVFVTSPFIPQTLSKRKRSLESHYPTFFFGCSQLPGSRGSMGGNNEMHSRDSKSWEWGITLTSLCFRLSNEMALTSSLSIGQVHHHFKDNYVLSTQNGVSAMTPIEGETLKKSYFSYNVLRLPIMLEWQKRIGCHDAFLALGPSVEYRWHEFPLLHRKAQAYRNGRYQPQPYRLEPGSPCRLLRSDALRPCRSNPAAQQDQCSRVLPDDHRLRIQIVT